MSVAADTTTPPHGSTTRGLLGIAVSALLCVSCAAFAVGRVTSSPEAVTSQSSVAAPDDNPTDPAAEDAPAGGSTGEASSVAPEAAAPSPVGDPPPAPLDPANDPRITGASWYSECADAAAACRVTRRIAVSRGGVVRHAYVVSALVPRTAGDTERVAHQGLVVATPQGRKVWSERLFEATRYTYDALATDRTGFVFVSYRTDLASRLRIVDPFSSSADRFSSRLLVEAYGPVDRDTGYRPLYADRASVPGFSRGEETSRDRFEVDVFTYSRGTYVFAGCETTRGFGEFAERVEALDAGDEGCTEPAPRGTRLQPS